MSLYWVLTLVFAADVNRRKDRVMNEARKVVENINAMSFMNLDDQQVHSLMMMREIARGIVNNKVAKVSERGKVMGFFSLRFSLV